MPLVEIIQSSTNRLDKGEYHLITRKKGLSFRKTHSDDPYDTLLILTLKPTQINKVEFIDTKNDYQIKINAVIPERLGELIESTIVLKSIEIPASVLFEKLDLLFNDSSNLKRMEIHDENQEEDLEEDPLINFLKSFDAVFVESFREGFQAGLSFVKSGLANIQETLRKSIKSLKNISLPLLGQNQDKDDIIEVLEFKEQYITINKISHCYIDAVNKQNQNKSETEKIIIFLHGLGFSQKIWEKYLTNFYLNGFRVISYDLRGHGKTQRPEKLKYCKYEQIQQDFDEFVSALDLEKEKIELSLVTFSSTGMILIRLLEKKCPKGLKNLILLSSSDHVSKDLTKICRRIPVPEVWLPLKEQAVDRAKQSLFTNPQAVYANEILEIPLRTDANVLSESFRSLGDKKFENYQKYKKIQNINLLAIVGSNDPIYPPESISKFKNSFENATLKSLDGANHFFPFENDEYINFTIKEVSNFIENPLEE